MKEYIEIIECRDCESKNCDGCNVFVLSQMLNEGKFDSLMDEHHCINPAADVVERKRGEWISVTERLPEDNSKVLVCSTKGTIVLTAYDHHWKRWMGFSNVVPTHWMPLPEPPKEV